MDRFLRIYAADMPTVHAMIEDGMIAVPDAMFTNSIFTEIEFASDRDVAAVDSLVWLGLFSN